MSKSKDSEVSNENQEGKPSVCDIYDLRSCGKPKYGELDESGKQGELLPDKSYDLRGSGEPQYGELEKTPPIDRLEAKYRDEMGTLPNENLIATPFNARSNIVDADAYRKGDPDFKPK